MQNRRYFLCTLLIAFIIFIACLLMAGPMRAGLPVGGDLPTRLAVYPGKFSGVAARLVELDDLCG